MRPSTVVRWLGDGIRFNENERGLLPPIRLGFSVSTGLSILTSLVITWKNLRLPLNDRAQQGDPKAEEELEDGIGFPYFERAESGCRR